MIQTGRARAALACAILIGGMAACRGDTHPQVPTTFNKISDNQTATVGTAVAIPPKISILDADGRGIAGILVTFTLATGGGTLTGATATTDADGVATAGSWILGTVAGINTLTARAAKVPGSPVTLNAIAIAGAPTALVKVSQDAATAPAGAIVDSIVVKVSDKFGNPVGGAAVTFAVTAGGGSVSPTNAVTGANGQAAARWIVGDSSFVQNTATATCAGVATPITFGLTSGPPVSTVHFSSHEYVVDSSATITPPVAVIDPQGSPISGAGITLAIRSAPTATLSGATVTGAQPGQTFIVASSTDDPTAKDSAVLIVANVASPVVRADVPRFDLKADTVFTVPIIIDMRSSGENVGAATVQLTWNPAALSYVGDAVGDVAAGEMAINTSSTASGSLLVTFASQSGYGGFVVLRNVTFRAATTSGSRATLLLSVSDLVSVGTLKNLLPKTVSSFYPFKVR
jgi:hypothetical protein